LSLAFAGRTGAVMDETATLEAERAALKRTSRHLFGAGPADPASELEAIAAWLRYPGNFTDPDKYGAGPLIEDFEAEVAALFGVEAARFMPSGCMAQTIALRIWSDRAGNPVTAFHPTSHLELHEEHGYRGLHGLTAHLLGEADRPTVATDVARLIGPVGPAHASGIASLLVELPAREIGGQLPQWDELVALSDLCRAEGIRLHLDGARVWQAAPAYGRSLAEIAALFDSIYVSFYKDIGALPGAMLLGPRDFIDEAAIWQRRQGGTLFTAIPNVVSARIHLHESLARMPRLVERAREVAALFAAHDGVTITPDPPHTSMFHLRIDRDVETLLAKRDEAARRTGIWITNTMTEVAGQPAASTELSMGPSSLTVADDELAEAIAIMLAG
jgi:threonine aldolase